MGSELYREGLVELVVLLTSVPIIKGEGPAQELSHLGRVGTQRPWQGKGSAHFRRWKRHLLRAQRRGGFKEELR